MIPPVGQKRRSGKGAATASSQRTPPESLGRKEFQHAEAARGKRHRLGDRGATGHHRHARAHKRIGERGRRAGAHQIAGAGIDRGLDVGGRGHGADADDGLGHLARDGAHRVERGGGAQRDLDHLEPAGNERPGERHCDGDALDGQHRDNPDAFEQRSGIEGGHGVI